MPPMTVPTGPASEPTAAPASTPPMPPTASPAWSPLLGWLSCAPRARSFARSRRPSMESLSRLSMSSLPLSRRRGERQDRDRVRGSHVLDTATPPPPIPPMSARIRIGTQGWNYDAWVGPFYPSGTRQADYLTVYARAFDTVEVDSTFYA